MHQIMLGGLQVAQGFLSIVPIKRESLPPQVVAIMDDGANDSLLRIKSQLQSAIDTTTQLLETVKMLGAGACARYPERCAGIDFLQLRPMVFDVVVRLLVLNDHFEALVEEPARSAEVGYPIEVVIVLVSRHVTHLEEELSAWKARL